MSLFVPDILPPFASLPPFPSTTEPPEALEAVESMEKKLDDDADSIDELIDNLQSEDGDHPCVDELEIDAFSDARPAPEELLQTDPVFGLTSEEVSLRRKKFGFNQMSESKENLVLKFCMYFIGPIQFVMEVSFSVFLVCLLPCLL